MGQKEIYMYRCIMPTCLLILILTVTLLSFDKVGMNVANKDQKVMH